MLHERRDSSNRMDSKLRQDAYKKSADDAMLLCYHGLEDGAGSAELGALGQVVQVMEQRITCRCSAHFSSDLRSILMSALPLPDRTSGAQQRHFLAGLA